MGYFESAWTALYRNKMYDDFTKLKFENPYYDIWVTGHSLGGALATITARHISGGVADLPKRVKLVTFGQPRVGTKGFADVCER
ncbi:class 3 lipase protein, partial [Aphelenchoides avenae]